MILHCIIIWKNILLNCKCFQSFFVLFNSKYVNMTIWKFFVSWKFVDFSLVQIDRFLII